MYVALIFDSPSEGVVGDVDGEHVCARLQQVAHDGAGLAAERPAARVKKAKGGPQKK